MVDSPRQIWPENHAIFGETADAPAPAVPEILLTFEDLLGFRLKEKELADEIRRLQIERSIVKRKLDAAEVLAEGMSGMAAPEAAS